MITALASDGPPPNVDVLCGMLLVLSLCSHCSSTTCSAQTCFSLPPINSLLSERGQKSGTVTYPGGGVKDSPLPSLPWEMDSSSPFLYFVYTWVSFSLGSVDKAQKEKPYPVSSPNWDCSDRSISVPRRFLWSHCECKNGERGTPLSLGQSRTVRHKSASLAWRMHFLFTRFVQMSSLCPVSQCNGHFCTTIGAKLYWVPSWLTFIPSI